MKKMTETPLKLNRETLRALAPAPAQEAGFIVTSTCKSGWTCCNQ